MGFQENQHGGLEPEAAKKRVVSGVGVPSRPPLKSIRVRCDGDEEWCSTTPTREEARVPTVLTCPPAPRKKKMKPSKCSKNNVREFFSPPDLETVFMQATDFSSPVLDDS